MVDVNRRRGVILIDVFIAFVVVGVVVAAFYKYYYRSMSERAIMQRAMVHAQAIYQSLQYLESNSPVQCSFSNSVSTASVPTDSNLYELAPQAYFVQACFNGLSVSQLTGVVLNGVKAPSVYEEEAKFWMYVDKYLKLYSNGKYKIFVYNANNGNVYSADDYLLLVKGDNQFSLSNFLQQSINLAPGVNGLVGIAASEYVSNSGYWAIYVQGLVIAPYYMGDVKGDFDLAFSNAGYTQVCNGAHPTTQKIYSNLWTTHSVAGGWYIATYFSTYICIPVGVRDTIKISDPSISDTIEGLSIHTDLEFPSPDSPYNYSSGCRRGLTGFSPAKYVYRHFVINYKNSYYEVFAFAGVGINSGISETSGSTVIVRKIGSPSDVTDDPIVIDYRDSYNSDCNFSFALPDLFPVNAPQINVN